MILIGIGGNLPGPEAASPLETCNAALDAVAGIPGLSLVTASPWYRSTPISQIYQPDFCNGIIRLEGEIEPLALLAALQAIENRFGREREAGVKNAPRTLDLDIIDLNGTIRAIPPVILPHPRAHLRAFVLRPILDVAPGWRHPALRRGVASLLADLPPQAIAPWQM